MIELINIFGSFLLFLLFFSAPLPILKTNKNSVDDNQNYKLYFKLSLNILIHFNLILIFSFFNLELKYYFYSALLLSIFLNIKILFHKHSRIVINYTFILFCFITISLFLKISVDLKLEWDGLNHWLPKALLFYNGESISNIKNLGFTEYPHLGTYIWAMFWKNSFLQYEYFGRLIYIFFYTSSLFCVFESFFEKNLFVKGIFIFFITILTYDIFLFSGYQEYLLFSSLVVLSKYFYSIYSENSKANNNLYNYLIPILIFQPIMWFKDEGIFYYLIILICFIFFSKINKAKYFLVFATIFFPILQFLLQKYILGIYGFQAEIMHENILENFKFEILIKKIFMITYYIFISMLKYKLWIVNLISLFSIMFFFKKEIKKIKPWIYILFLNYILIFLIYIHTPYNLEFLLKVTLDRVMFQTSGFYIIFTLILSAKIYNSSKNRKF